MTKRKIIYILSYLAYSSIYIARVNLTMANPSFVSMGILDTVEIGLLGGIFSAVFASGRLVNGMFSDKTPPYMMISGGLALCAVSNIAIGFLPPFIAIFLLWSVNAYAQSMLWGSIILTMSQLYDESTAKKRTAFLSTSVAAGNIVGILFCMWLITVLGVQYAFVVPGIITLVLGVVFLLAAKDVSPGSGEKKHLSIVDLIGRKELRLISIPAFLHGIPKENVSLWMTVYIIDTYNVDLSTSAYYLLLIPAFGFVGRVVHQVFYKLTRENEHTVSLIGFVLCIVFSAMLTVRVTAIYSILCLTALYAAVSMINTSFLSIYPHRYRSEGNVSSVSGILDFVTYLGAAFGSLIYGVMIKHFGYGSMFISFALFSAIGMIVIFKFVNIRGKKQ